MNISPKIIEELNQLLIRNRDAMNGYSQVAEAIPNQFLTKWLIDFSDERKKFVQQLNTEIINHDGVPEEGQSTLGEIHQFWVKIKAEWTDNDMSSLVEECLRGERMLLKDYSSIINSKQIPNRTNSILKQQLEKIKIAIDDLSLLQKTFIIEME